MGKLIKVILVIAMAFITTSTLYATPTTITKQNSPLLAIAKQKGTVGIIPYYVKNGKLYIFLGQERIGGKKESSGTFSDFGGSTKLGATIVHNAIREFSEETMGQMRLKEEDVLRNSVFLFKKSATNREIYYIFYKFSEKQYQQSKKFNVVKVRLNASSVPNSFLEKEHFEWVSVDDLIQQTLPETDANQRFVVKNSDGATLNILIRGYFLQDCLQNPELSGLLQKLIK